MTINLPLDTILEPQYRFLCAKSWDANWTVLKPPGIGGFFLEEFWREALPGVGQLVFRYDAGMFQNPKSFGMLLGINTTGGTNAESDDINLIGSIIRLQMAAGSTDPSNVPTWKTVFCGVVEHQEDTSAPGSAYLLAQRKFICMDLLASFTKRWPIRYHGLYVADTGSPAGTNATAKDVFYLQCEGLPGYNSRNTDGRILGNKSSKKYYDAAPEAIARLPWASDNLSPGDTTTFQSKLICHSFQGLGTPWTDLEAVENILAVCRPPFAPFFYFVGNLQLLNLTSFRWETDVSMKAWDFLAGVCDRRRGRGVAFLDWADDSETQAITATPSHAFTPYIRVTSQSYDYIYYTQPVSDPSNTGTHRIDGALNQSTSINVDLVGDHRNVGQTFSLGDRYQHTYDAVETLGEPLQVLVNLNLDAKSLSKQWLKGEETTIVAATAIQRTVYRFDPVYQLYGLNMGWDGTASNGNASTGRTRVDWRVGDDGKIVDFTNPALFAASIPDTAPDSVTLLNDIPLFCGYDYSLSTPARYDTTGPEMIPPDRRPMLLLYRKSGSDLFARADLLPYISFSVRIFNRWRIELIAGDDMTWGNRRLAPASVSTLGGGAIDINLVTIACGLELPHRLRMQSLSQVKDDNITRPFRKQVVLTSGFHLWLADPNAIWDLDNSLPANAGYLTPKRNAASSTGLFPGITRDDRDKFAIYHALAASWYLEARRTATWQLRDCGFLPSFQSLASAGDQTSGTSVTYPKIGDFVHTLTQGGIAYTVNTPITKVHYSHTAANGITTWVTDWSDLDLR